MTTRLPGHDEKLFQNLIGTEWIIFGLYQNVVDILNESGFSALGSDLIKPGPRK